MSAKLDKLIFAGVLVATVFTAIAHGAVEAWSIAVFQLIVILLVLTWAVKAVVDRRVSVMIPLTALPLLGLLALGTIQCLASTGSTGIRSSLSIDVEATRRAVSVLFFVIALVVIAGNSLGNRERLRGLANLLVIYGLVLAVFALLQQATWNGHIYWLRPATQGGSPFGPFVNRNHFAGYMEMLLPIPVALIVTRFGRKEARVFYGFAAVIMGLAAIVSLSRAGMIAITAELIFAFALGMRARVSGDQGLHLVGSVRREAGVSWKSAISQVSAGLAIVVAIIVGTFWIGSEPVVNRLAGSLKENQAAESQNILGMRQQIWQNTLRMVKANPLTGVGLGAFETAYPIYSQTDDTNEKGRNVIVDYAHNDYLQVLSDGGLVAAAIAIWFIFSVFRAVAFGLRTRDPLLRALALASGTGVFALLVHSLFDFNLQIPSNAVLFLLLATIASHVSATVMARKGERVVRHHAAAAEVEYLAEAGV